MKYEIVGAQRKSGEYEGRPYDNTYLHVLNVNPNVTGRQAGTVKLKTSAFGNIMQEHGISANDLLGRTVNIAFDQYRNVESVELLDKSGK